MTFDVNKTLDIVRSALLEPEPTWDKYLLENHKQIDTATLITLPLLAVCLLVGVITQPVSLAVFSILMLAVGIAAWTWISNFFAGKFEGTSDPDRAFAAVSLAMVPALLGNVVGIVPMVGWLISIGMGLYSLVLLYKVLPLALSLPEESRVKHFVASLLSVMVVMIVMTNILGGAMIRDSMVGIPDDDAPLSGMFTGIQQNADYAEQAQADRYSPPDDGELSDRQVATFVSVVTKTRTLQNEQMEKMKAMSKQAKESDNQADDVDVSSFFKAMSGVTSIGFSEMKVVKTGGLNWAEHQWVRQQLEIARIQKDLNDAVKHNYALYQEYEEELQEYF